MTVHNPPPGGNAEPFSSKTGAARITTAAALSGRMSCRSFHRHVARRINSTGRREIGIRNSFEGVCYNTQSHTVRLKTKRWVYSSGWIFPAFCRKHACFFCVCGKDFLNLGEGRNPPKKRSEFYPYFCDINVLWYLS